MPSWLFGDGAALLNEIAQAFGITPRISPLDAVLNNPLADRTGGASVGFRASRAITPRFAAELSVDYAQTSFEERPDVESGLRATTTSFTTVFQNQTLLPTGLFVSKNVTSAYSLEFSSGSEITTTGAIKVNLLTRGRIIPYATGGAGVSRQRGDAPVATAQGGYSFRLANVFPFDERDTVNLAQTFDESVLIGVAGGGVNAFLTQRSGIRVDVRVHMGNTTDRVVLDATPRVTAGSPASYIASGTNPSLSFSNYPQPSVFPPSTLSGTAINDFTTFGVDRTRTQVLWAVGYFFRF